MHGVRYHAVLVSLVTPILIVLCLEVQATPPSEALMARRVPQIRFGIVEPPVVAQKDITVRAPMSNQQLEPAALECSGMVWINGTLLLTSDRHSHTVFIAPVDLDQMTVKDPVQLPIIGNEQDLLEDGESMTVRVGPNGEYIVYMLSSMSNDRSELAFPKRQHFVRFSLLPSVPLKVVHNTSVIGMNPVREAISAYFERAGIEPYRTYCEEFTGPNKNTYRWGNIEGIAFTPDGTGLLCGMRNPLQGDSAVLFVLNGIDQAFDNRDSTSLKVVDMFTMSLGRRGVSDLCWDPVTKGYLITAATSNGPRLSQDQPWPPNELDSALFWWSGRKSERPILFATFPDMKIEAVCRLGSSPYIAVGSDERDVSEGRTRTAQSILTILYFNGLQVPQ
jgi:hypothetical protein